MSTPVLTQTLYTILVLYSFSIASKHDPEPEPEPEPDTKGDCEVKAYEFYWRGQISGFTVNGRFSFNYFDIPHNLIACP